MNGRETQISEIKRLIRSKQTSFFITGLPSTGKTLISTTIFSTLGQNVVAWVNCSECLSLKVLYERALNQWSSGSDYLPCLDADSFVYSIQQLEKKERRFLVLDQADELMDLGSATLLPFLTRLAELTGTDICVVYISHLTWDDFLSQAPALSPPKVIFPSYTKLETFSILCKDRPIEEEEDFYLGFVELLYGSFHTACKDLNELRYLCKLLFPKYLEPVTKGGVARDQRSKLFTKIQPILKKQLNTLYLRDVSCIEWQSHLEDEDIVTTSSKRIEMPYMTKFLLIASFLASFNPSKYDSRFFTRGGEGRSKVGKKGGVNNGSIVRNQLTGPRPFAAERMLAIFYSILNDDCKMTFDIHSQIATCVSLRLLTRVSASNRLDMIKLKCNISFQLVKSISKTVRFDVAKYLFDFVDV